MCLLERATIQGSRTERSRAERPMRHRSAASVAYSQCRRTNAHLACLPHCVSLKRAREHRLLRAPRCGFAARSSSSAWCTRALCLSTQPLVRRSPPSARKPPLLADRQPEKGASANLAPIVTLTCAKRYESRPASEAVGAPTSGASRRRAGPRRAHRREHAGPCLAASRRGIKSARHAG